MDWKVRFVNYPEQFRKMEREILGTVREVLSRGDLMLRGQLRDFEAHIATFVGTRFAIGVSNCTDGLHLALRAAGIGAEDEVITVAHSFVATAAAIHHAGASPVLVDIGDDHNIDVDGIASAITSRTRAIVPVHLNGRLCEMGRLMAIARERGLIVIEDSAQALGGAFEGRRGGSFGLAGCFSFYPAKRLRARGIEILIPWGGRGIHQFKALGLTHHHLPRTDQLFRGVLMLPLHAELEDRDVGYVSDVIREFYV